MNLTQKPTQISEMQHHICLFDLKNTLNNNNLIMNGTVIRLYMLKMAYSSIQCVANIICAPDEWTGINRIFFSHLYTLYYLSLMSFYYAPQKVVHVYL